MKQTITRQHTKMSDAKANPNVDKSNVYDAVVFCHLRWDFVYQRPQHIISRLADSRKILIIEEPIGYSPEEENTGVLRQVNDQIYVLQPRVANIEAIANILPQYLSDSTVPLVWFYSASFVPLLLSMKYEKVVYDCMDELTMFKGARPELREQERYLLSEADVVFTGGKSLYDSKRSQHSNVFCFPSSVDRAHFGKALNGIEVANDLPTDKPIVGYYGVIDERINTELLREVAEKTPEVNFVMIGPLAKIEEKDLPRAANLHYIGMAPYAKLPNYLKGFDIAMMPFALNDSTKYISPTKTLEYMAAGKPIISTPIFDVVREYSDCVAIIDSAEEFSAEVRRLLVDKKASASSCADLYEKILQETSWDNTVDKMIHIIKQIA